MAVIDTGERQVAFVAREPGKFEPRRVTTGVRSNEDELQVLEGLAPGERVVVSGQFLLDSESRLREATLKMLEPGTQETGEAIATSARPHAHGIEKDMHDAEPARKWVCPMPSHAGILYDQPGDCPLCGMKLVPVRETADAAARRIDHWTCPMPEHYDVHAEAPGKCPECGMTLIPVTRAEMERYARSMAEAAGATSPTLYVCPMESHKHIVRDEPGHCPECNMVLKPTSEVPFGAESEAIWREAHATSGTAAQ
jgi:rubrerythrin